jgi:hypothetical protein
MPAAQRTSENYTYSYLRLFNDGTRMQGAGCTFDHADLTHSVFTTHALIIPSRGGLAVAF